MSCHAHHHAGLSELGAGSCCLLPVALLHCMLLDPSSSALSSRGTLSCHSLLLSLLLSLSSRSQCRHMSCTTSCVWSSSTERLCASSGLVRVERLRGQELAVESVTRHVIAYLSIVSCFLFPVSYDPALHSTLAVSISGGPASTRVEYVPQL